jgi:predicted O-linked N-acetylglucosamine transferase (SPINDLY family)
MSSRVVTLAQAIDEALAHQTAGRRDDAARIYRQVLGVAPGHVTALNQLALIAADADDLAEAIQLTRLAVQADPRFVVGHANLGNLLKADGRVDEAVVAYRTALALDPTQIAVHRSLLNALLYLSDLDPEQRFAEHLAFARQHQPPAEDALPPPANDRDPARPLRIGIVSADLHIHPVARNLMPLFEHHDRGAFALFCYADVPTPDAYTERLRGHADGWRSTSGLSDRAIAELVRADAIDVMLVLAGVFDRNRPLVACYRPAPVQVSMFDGATSGVRGLDYWVGDPIVCPPDGRERFTEQVVRIPTLFSYQPLDLVPDPGPPPAAANGFVTFGSFNRPSKISHAALAAWAAVLHAVPSARLALRYRNFFSREPAQARFRAAFAAHGISAERLVFLPGIPALGHLQAIASVDIALDTTPFAGATTTFDTLSVGVPVIALAGDTAMSRLSATLLHAVGLDDLIAVDPAAFVRCATALAADLGRLAALRASLRARVASSPLCDGPAYARSLEALWRRLWRDWCRSPLGGA